MESTEIRSSSISYRGKENSITTVLARKTVSFQVTAPTKLKETARETEKGEVESRNMSRPDYFKLMSSDYILQPTGNY